MPATIKAVDAWMNILVAEWNYSVWNCDLEIGDTILHLDEYDQANPPNQEEYVLCWNLGEADNEDLGHQTHYKGRYGVATEIHSRRGRDDELSYEGLLEVHRIYAKRKLSPGQGYRKAWKRGNGEEITKHPVFKWLFKIDLEEDLTLY